MRIPKASLPAVNAFLKQVGLAAEVDSPMKKGVSLGEAQNIAKAFDDIKDPVAKGAVQNALLQLIQTDAFEVKGPQAKTVIANLLGKPEAEVFSSRDHAALVGGASLKKVGAAILSKLAKMPEMSKADTEALLKNMQDLPKSAQILLTAVLKNASADGLFKFQPDARPAFTRTFAKLDGESGGNVTEVSEKFNTANNDKRMSFFASRMFNSPYIEDQIAAVMFMVVSETMKEVQKDLQEMNRLTEADAQRQQIADAKKKAIQLAGAGGGGAAATAAPGANASAGAGTPAVAVPANDRVANLRTQYEQLTSDVASHRLDDGVIDRNEATALVRRLDAIDPAAKTLQAQALGRAMSFSFGDDPSKMGNATPLVEWVKKTLGVDKLEDIPGAKGLYESKDDLAKSIGGVDKLENKVAASMIAGLFAPRVGELASFKADMERMQPMLDEIEKHMVGKAVVDGNAAPEGKTPADKVQDIIGKLATAIEKNPAVAKNLANVKGVAEKLVANAGVPMEQRAGVVAGTMAAIESLKAGKGVAGAEKAADVAVAADVNAQTKAATAGKPELSLANEQGITYMMTFVNDAHSAAANELSAAKDVGKPLSGPQADDVLTRHMDAAKAKLAGELKKQGFSADQVAASGASVDALAAPVVAELHKTGKLTPPDAPSGSTDVAPTETDSTRSRQIMFEQLKLKMQMQSEMQQAMSNILNSIHQNAESAIRAIR